MSDIITTEADLNAEAEALVASTARATASRNLAVSLLEGDEAPEEKTFSSDNQGYYLTAKLTGPEARRHGLSVPIGGNVTVSVMVIVVDPANKKKAKK